MPYNLVFDADDTLWENNVLFERAIELVIGHVTDAAREQVRSRLDDIEKVNSAQYGYGVDVFERSLGECLREFRGELRTADHELLREACAPIRAQQVELIDGVRDTLRTLAQRHPLFLLTKGEHTEQTGKINASGLAELFADIVIVPEKDEAVYTSFVTEHGLARTDTWMIGNSPRSDIWPALRAGIGAVLVPHPMTWSLENREPPYEAARFHTVSPFARLTAHF